jgi:hypothetical protein
MQAGAASDEDAARSISVASLDGQIAVLSATRRTHSH